MDPGDQRQVSAAGGLLLLDELDVTGFATPRRPRQPAPNEVQRGATGLIEPHRTARPAGQHFTFGGQTLKKKLDRVGACNTAYLIANPDPAALIVAGYGASIDNVMKDRASTGEPLCIVRYRESAIVQALGDG